MLVCESPVDGCSELGFNGVRPGYSCEHLVVGEKTLVHLVHLSWWVMRGEVIMREGVVSGVVLTRSEGC